MVGVWDGDCWDLGVGGWMGWEVQYKTAEDIDGQKKIQWILDDPNDNIDIWKVQCFTQQVKLWLKTLSKRSKKSFHMNYSNRF